MESDSNSHQAISDQAAAIERLTAALEKRTEEHAALLRRYSFVVNNHLELLKKGHALTLQIEAALFHEKDELGAVKPDLMLGGKKLRTLFDLINEKTVALHKLYVTETK